MREDSRGQFLAPGRGATSCRTSPAAAPRGYRRRARCAPRTAPRRRRSAPASSSCRPASRGRRRARRPGRSWCPCPKCPSGRGRGPGPRPRLMAPPGQDSCEGVAMPRLRNVVSNVHGHSPGKGRTQRNTRTIVNKHSPQHRPLNKRSEHPPIFTPRATRPPTAGGYGLTSFRLGLDDPPFLHPKQGSRPGPFQ